MPEGVATRHARLFTLLKFIFSDLQSEFKKKLQLDWVDHINPQTSLDRETVGTLLKEIKRIIEKLNLMCSFTAVNTTISFYKPCMADFFRFIIAFSYAKNEFVASLNQLAKETHHESIEIELVSGVRLKKLMREVANHPLEHLRHWNKDFPVLFRTCFPEARLVECWGWKQLEEHPRGDNQIPLPRQTHLKKRVDTASGFELVSFPRILPTKEALEVAQLFEAYANPGILRGWGFFRNHLEVASEIVACLRSGEWTLDALIRKKEELLRSAKEVGAFRAVFKEIEERYGPFKREEEAQVQAMAACSC